MKVVRGLSYLSYPYGCIFSCLIEEFTKNFQSFSCNFKLPTIVVNLLSILHIPNWFHYESSLVVSEFILFCLLKQSCPCFSHLNFVIFFFHKIAYEFDFTREAAAMDRIRHFLYENNKKSPFLVPRVMKDMVSR